MKELNNVIYLQFIKEDAYRRRDTMCCIGWFERCMMLKRLMTKSFDTEARESVGAYDTGGEENEKKTCFGLIVCGADGLGLRRDVWIDAQGT